mgnify:FL=1
MWRQRRRLARLLFESGDNSRTGRESTNHELHIYPEGINVKLEARNKKAIRNEVNSRLWGDELGWCLCHFISRLVEVVRRRLKMRGSRDGAVGVRYFGDRVTIGIRIRDLAQNVSGFPQWY